MDQVLPLVLEPPLTPPPPSPAATDGEGTDAAL
jgi:hypothetical protein